MSYSPLVDKIIISPNCTKPRNHIIDTITVHHMAGDMTIEQCGYLFQRPARKASSNYGIGSDGRIGLYCDEKNRAWTSGNGPNDHRAITIEVANNTLGPNWTISDKAMESLIELLVDICLRNNIKELLWKNDKNLIGQVDKQNITLHRWFQNTLCPGPYIESEMDYIVKQVNSNLEVERMTKQELKVFIEDTVRAMGRGLEPSDWAKAGVEVAKTIGITDGSNPQAWCTRQEAMLMSKRAFELANSGEIDE